MTDTATFESTSRTVRVDSGELHYHEASDGPPPGRSMPVGCS